MYFYGNHVIFYLLIKEKQVFKMDYSSHTVLGFVLGFYLWVFAYLFVHGIVTALLFNRAGEGALKAFIPFYSSFTAHKIAFGPKANLFWLLNFITFGVYPLYQWFNFARSFGLSTRRSALYLFFPVILSLFMLADGQTYVGPQKHIFLDNE